MELDVTQVKSVEPGRHTGIVMKVESRKVKDYDYTDITVMVDEDEVELRISAPTKLSVSADSTPKSKLATILNKLGVELTGRVDVDSIVKKKIKFVTTEKVTDSGTFAEIDVNSIALLTE